MYLSIWTTIGKILLYTIIGIVALIALLAVVLGICYYVITFKEFLIDKYKRWKWYRDGNEGDYDAQWIPKYYFKHEGVKLTNLPFTPYRYEVVYIEDQYDEAANRFVRENIEMIKEKIAKKGYRFTYLPYLSPSRDEVVGAVKSMYPEGIDEATIDRIANAKLKPLASSYLLDFMYNPQNRHDIKPSFAWFNVSYTDKEGQAITIYDMTPFDGEEALADPEQFMEELSKTVGHNNTWVEGVSGVFCMAKINPAEDKFGDEARKLLEEVRAHLEQVRLMGVGEAMIAEYIRPAAKLSHLTVTHDLRLILDDYQQREVVMEPLNKAVYLLFLRHPEGINFKCLSDYRQELHAIYMAVKDHRNDIDRRMKHTALALSISKGVKNTTNPLNNAINEKCARIREAFLQIVHAEVAEHYIVSGVWGAPKNISLPRDMVTWEEE